MIFEKLMEIVDAPLAYIGGCIRGHGESRGFQ